MAGHGARGAFGRGAFGLDARLHRSSQGRAAAHAGQCDAGAVGTGVGAVCSSAGLAGAPPDIGPARVVAGPTAEPLATGSGRIVSGGQRPLGTDVAVSSGQPMGPVPGGRRLWPVQHGLVFWALFRHRHPPTLHEAALAPAGRNLGGGSYGGLDRRSGVLRFWAARIRRRETREDRVDLRQPDILRLLPGDDDSGVARRCPVSRVKSDDRCEGGWLGSGHRRTAPCLGVDAQPRAVGWTDYRHYDGLRALAGRRHEARPGQGSRRVGSARTKRALVGTRSRTGSCPYTPSWSPAASTQESTSGECRGD